MEDELKKFYIHEQLLQPNNEEVYLHVQCNNKDICWESESKIEQFGDSYNRIAKPYIGKNYKQFKLLVLGLNLNQYGGYHELHSLVEQTIPFLERGSKKINFNADNYSGSLFWHRAYVYASIVLSYLNGNDYNSLISNDYYIDDFERLLQTVNDISFAESIKCSPGWHKSTPTNQMKSLCPKYILSKEIEIIKPNKIIVLGKENWHIIRGLGNIIEDDWWYSRAFYTKLDLGYNQVDIYGTVHPCSHGGSSRAVIEEFTNLVFKRHIVA